MKPLRVAITARSVFPIHGPGGLERSVYDLARYLARHDIEVTLITRTPKAGHPADIHPSVELKFVPYRTFPLAGRRGTTVIDRSTAYPLFGARAGAVAADLVQRGAIDIVHGFGASVLGYARRRARRGAPLVLNPQGLEEFGATDPSRARLKRMAYLPLRRAVITCARAADAVIATDRALEPVVRAHLGVPSERIATIPNGLDLDAVDALAGPGDGRRIRMAHDIAPDVPVLLSVGRLEANKGFHLLAHALAALREHSGRLARGPWRWVLVGDGPNRGRLAALVAELELTPHVLFAGRTSDADLHAWYEAADLFVHPTLYEGSSLVTLEAMAHRRACVVTDAGGLPDKVRNGTNGWIVPAGDTAALTAAISGALEQPERLVRYGHAGRAIVDAEFSWTAIGRQTVALYRGLLERLKFEG
jgi:glycosyltransferase involved in cell wall biosynthesis